MRRDNKNSYLPLEIFACRSAICSSPLPDRRRVHQLVERKVPVGEIARQLGRHRSTIYRELKRNTFHDAAFPEYSGYCSGIANDISKERRRTAAQAQPSPRLRELVIEQLKVLWSPEQIAGGLLADGVSAVRGCTETTYRFIYGKEDYALNLFQHVPEGRRKRRGSHRSLHSSSCDR